MGLRCLLGHDFGDVEVEREREEDGNEMVVTIREVETCTRCEERRIVSENKEVTSIKTPQDVGLDDAAESTGADDEDHSSGAADDEPAEPTHPAVEGDEEFEPADDPVEDDGVILEDGPADREPGEWPDVERPQSQGESADAEEDTNAGSPGDPDADPDARTAIEDDARSSGSDDAPTGGDSDLTEADDTGEPVPADGESEDVEFLDAESATENGSTADADGATEPAAAAASEDRDVGEWPEHEDVDEGFDAELAGSEGVTFSGNGLTPEVDADEPTEDAEYIEADATGAPAEVSTDPTRDVSSGIARDAPASVELSSSKGDTEFYCPNCELTRLSDGSSMRAGDICPKCRKGYITERDA